MFQNPRSTATIGHPLHGVLVPIPITRFAGTLGSDLAYWRTAKDARLIADDIGNTVWRLAGSSP